MALKRRASRLIAAGIGALLAALPVVTPSAREPARTAGLDALLARATDRAIRTERGNIRVIAFGRQKAKSGGAIFFIHGDPEWFRLGTYSDALKGEEARILGGHLGWLAGVAERGTVATYFVARTGAFGSEGETTDFRSEESYLSIGHAIDKVIDADGIATAAIIGHSGGAAVALYHATNLTTPAVPCYVLASGVYNLGAMGEFVRQLRLVGGNARKIDPSALGPRAFEPLPADVALRFHYHETLFQVARMPVAAARRFVAVSDPSDTTAPYFASQDVVRRLAALGHMATLVETAAKPPTYHITYDAAIKAASSCLKDTATRRP